MPACRQYSGVGVARNARPGTGAGDAAATAASASASRRHRRVAAHISRNLQTDEWHLRQHCRKFPLFPFRRRSAAATAMATHTQAVQRLYRQALRVSRCVNDKKKKSTSPLWTQKKGWVFSGAAGMTGRRCLRHAWLTRIVRARAGTGLFSRSCGARWPLRSGKSLRYGRNRWPIHFSRCSC